MTLSEQTDAQKRSDAAREDCLREASRWVHLRYCRTCGHVGCCDSSSRRDARHHARNEEHPIISSIESGEDWSWCYIDCATVNDPGGGVR